jgi:hypothetical protein
MGKKGKTLCVSVVNQYGSKYVTAIMNCYSERIPRRFCLTAVLRGLRGYRANPKIVKFLTVAAKHCRRAKHSLQLAAGSFN